jgi:hypothetical protein
MTVVTPYFGLPLGESKVRSKYGVTIVGVKRAGQDFTHATPETVVEADDLIIVSGPRPAWSASPTSPDHDVLGSWLLCLRLDLPAGEAEPAGRGRRSPGE